MDTLVKTVIRRALLITLFALDTAPVASLVVFATNAFLENFASAVATNLTTQLIAALAAVVTRSTLIAPRARRAEILARIAKAA